MKIGTAQVALWKKAAKSSIRQMIRCGEDVPIGRSDECPEEGAIFGVKTLKSPDDPVPIMCWSSDDHVLVVSGVS